MNSTKFSKFHRSQHRPRGHEKKQKIIQTTIKDFHRTDINFLPGLWSSLILISLM